MVNVARQESLENTLLFTHRGCLDGSGCAIAFIHAGGKRENIRYVTAGTLEKVVDSNEFNSDKFLIFADVGLNDPSFADEFERRGNLVLLDHHRSSLHLSERDWCTIDMDACGSELTRRWLDSNRYLDRLTSHEFSSLAKFTAIIDDHDRWILKDDRSRDLAKVMSFYGQKEFIEEFLNHDARFYVNFWSDFEAKTLNVLNKKCNEAITRCLSRVKKRSVIIPTFSTTAVHVGYVLSSEENVSLLLAEMLAKNEDIDVACQVNPDKNMVSLRARRGGTDVSEFAANFGGGGHAAASGHPWPKGLLDMLIDEVHTSNVSRVENF